MWKFVYTAPAIPKRGAEKTKAGWRLFGLALPFTPPEAGTPTVTTEPSSRTEKNCDDQHQEQGQSITRKVLSCDRVACIL